MKKVTFITIIVLSIVTISLFGAAKDTTPPTVSITNPKDGAVVSGVVTIKVDSSDSSGIAKVEFYVGDSKLGEDSGKPYEYSWDTKKTKDGTYVLTVKATDGAGNKNSKSIKVVVKNTKVGTWHKTFGGKEYDQANYVQQTADGGYIVAGWSYSFDSGGHDAYILKLNSKGEVEWQKAFGGESSDGANSIQQTKDGGYIVAGWTNSFGSGGHDVYILKLNAKGEVEWQKTFGGWFDDVANSIQQTTDGGYIVAGWTSSSGSGGADVYILKLNSKGEVQWQETFGEKYVNDEANSIQQTADGGYIIAGWTASFGSGWQDVYILKLDSKGDLEWEKTFGGEGSDEANSIQQTTEGGYIVAGRTVSLGSGGKDIYILKLNSKGEAEWEKTFGGEGSDEANSIQQTTEGGYIVAGWTVSLGSGGKDVCILKLNSKGEAEWQKTFGGEYGDGASSVQQTTDGGYIVAGWTYSSDSQDVYILKLSSKGDIDTTAQGDIDTTPPEVKFISPSDGVEPGGTININIEATDDVELEKVILYIDGKKIKEYTSAPYTYTWDSSKATEGTHTITAEVVDKSGNVRTKSVTTIMDKIKDISWQKTFGGEDDDGANSIQQTSDGGYIVAGWTTSFGSGRYDVYILKLNSKGEVEWQKTFGGGDDDVAFSIQQTTDGGYIVAGWTNSFGYGGEDAYILKLNSKGEIEWQKTFGGEDSDGALSIQQTKDGGYIVAGGTSSFGSGGQDAYILKLNTKGEVEWQKTFGGAKDDVANSVQQTTDGGYIVAGRTYSFGSGLEDAYILKLNSKGDLEWQKTFGGKDNDGAFSIQQTKDGGYIVAGGTSSFGSGGQDAYILKLNTKGEVEWQKVFDGGDDDVAFMIQQTADGGYIAAGWTSSFGSGERDAYILKLNSKGEVEWQKTFGGEDYYVANSIQQTADGGYIAAGWTSSFGSGERDVYILKLNSKGEVDTTPPEVKILSPKDGAELGGTIEINIDATDDVELEKVILYIDGNKIKEYTSSPYKYSWDSSKAAEGAHTITAEAMDKSGNVGRKSVTLVMDKIKDTLWQKTFGGENSDWANSIQQTTDGGYIVAGWTDSFGSGEADVYILKLNSKGEVQSQKTFGGKKDDEANSIQQTTDGGYIVAGWTDSFGSGEADVYILKLNSKGEVQWQKTFGGKKDDEANSIQQTTDGGYIVAGWTDSFGSGEADVYILKLNSKGEVQWQKTFGGKKDDEANSIQQTTDGGYIVAGWTDSFDSGEADVYILKLNSKGEVQWQKTFGEEYSQGGANSIQQTTDGGYIVAGCKDGDVYILKLNSIGEVQWQKTFGGWYDDEANSIQQTTDGGYIVAGWTGSFVSGERDAYIFKLNSKGEVDWQKMFGGEDSDEAKSIQQTADGGYIVAGCKDGEVYILKLNSIGELDTTAPEVKILSPKDGAELGGTIEINIDATDDVELEKVTLYIDGKKIKEYTSGPYKYSWDSSKVIEEGAHTITAEAMDRSGNVGRKSVTLVMDKIKDISWEKTFGGLDKDRAESIQQTKDGGYIVAGWTGSFGSGERDAYIFKLNSKGEVQWQKTFGGKKDDVANSIQQTTDGGYIVAGWTGSFVSGERDAYIFKLNSKGEVEWQKMFGGEGSDEAKSIQQTKDGGYIVAGWTNSFGSGWWEDIYILKLNSKGALEWQKTFGGEGSDEANSIQQTTDGGYIVAGWTVSLGSGVKDIYILKLNSKGNLEWQKTFGGNYGNYDDEANSIQQTTDGGYIIAGWTYNPDSGRSDVYILKLNSKGQLEWQKTFGGNYDDGANSIQQTTDGGYIVAGWTYSFGSGEADVYILKLNSKGELEWEKTFRGKADDEAKSIQQTADGGYIIAGSTYFLGSGEADVYILKLDSKGWVDTTAPEVKILSPKDGAELGGTIEINIDATDDVELEKVTLYIDGKKIKEYTSDPYKYSWDSSKVIEEGAHTITVEAMDKSGNIATKSVTLVMDKIKDISWQKTFGGGNSDWANSIQQTKDGGYIVAGSTYSFGSGEADVYILKLNSKGELEWEKTFRGKADDEANSIQQTKDGGYIVAGSTYSFGSGFEDVYILKLNAKGDVEWQKTFGGKGYDGANSIQQTADGGYIVAGWTYSFGSGEHDVYILKLNAIREVEWQKTFGEEYSQGGANSIQQTTDGGYIVAGWTKSFDSREDVYILKLNSKGQLEWEKTFGGEYGDGASSVQQTTDGGYIVAGYEDGDVYILKLNAKGDLEWEKTFDGWGDDEAISIQQTTDGGYIVAGWTESFETREDVYILKLNSKGQLEWQKTFGGEDSDGVVSIQQTKDGGYIVAGWTKSFGSGLEDVYILKLNSKGEIEGE